jgi:hypothetical protein
MDSLLALNVDSVDVWVSNLEEQFGPLRDIEIALAAGDLSGANSLIQPYTPETNVQSNYKSYFILYHKYAALDSLSPADSIALWTLAVQCPGIDGPAVHKARALYNLIYKSILNLNDDGCEENGYSERIKSSSYNSAVESSILADHQKREIIGKVKNTYVIFPNPTGDFFYIRSTKPNERIEVTITDVNGRILQQEYAPIQNKRGKINVTYPNGMYFVHIKNARAELTIKKLIINK